MFTSSNIETPSAKTIISTVASATATAMLIRSLAREYLPRELQHYFVFKVKTFLKAFSPDITLVIEEYDNLNHNHLFKAAELYLEPIIPPNIVRLKVSMTKKEGQPSVSLDQNQEVVDTFKGVTLKWKFVSLLESGKRYVRDPNHYYNSLPISEKRYFELTFHKKHKSLVLDEYLKHVLEKSKETKEKKKTIKLFTLNKDRMGGGGRGNSWQGVNLDHPATFDTVAMELEVKNMIIEDLERFVKRKEFYRKVGKAWKRGYLLFGPPGTGKSSLIAAMANYLKFDIYDLELTELRGNTELRRLLTSTANKSILVVEDIDCSIELQDRRFKMRASIPEQKFGYNQPFQPEVTLSGFLNFIDGLWSSCGDERIIIFTTNFKEKLDPALLRPGRMDVHIPMSYCTPSVFKMLASNYLGITAHSLFAEIEEMIETTNVTPAEVVEQLMKSEEPEITLRDLITFLLEKKIKIEESAKTQASGSGVLEEKPEAAETCLPLQEEKTEIKPNSIVAEVGELIKTSNLTPAEVREQLMKSDEPEVAMRSLVKLLQDKKSKTIESKNTRGDGTGGKKLEAAKNKCEN